MNMRQRLNALSQENISIADREAGFPTQCYWYHTGMNFLSTRTMFRLRGSSSTCNWYQYGPHAVVQVS